MPTSTERYIEIYILLSIGVICGVKKSTEPMSKSGDYLEDLEKAIENTRADAERLSYSEPIKTAASSKQSMQK